MTAELKATPGPWEVRHTQGSQGEDDSHHVCTPNEIICGWWTWRNCPNAKANAHLIAAAPELYMWLSALAVPDARWQNAPHDLIEFAQAALKKARGES